MPLLDVLRARQDRVCMRFVHRAELGASAAVSGFSCREEGRAVR